MNRPTTLIALALLAAAATAAAHPYLATRSAVSHVDTSPLGFGFGIAFCEEQSPGLPTNCEVGGLTAAIFDATHLNGHSATQVEGSCLAQKGATSLGELEFICASDRDDDTFVTSADINGDDDSAGSDHGTNANGHDDQFYTGVVPSGSTSGSIGVCFTHDADSAAAGHDWDDFVVFVQGNLPTPYAGPVSLVLSLDDRAADC
jgi:hypothetical protein